MELKNINKIRYDETGTIIDTELQPLYGHSEARNAVIVETPLGGDLSYFGLFGKHVDGSVFNAEKLMMKAIGDVTVDGTKYWRFYQIVPGSVLATVMKQDTSVGFQLEAYDLEDDDKFQGVIFAGSEDTQAIKDEINAEVSDPEEDDYVRVIDTGSDWVYEDNEWKYTGKIQARGIYQARHDVVSMSVKESYDSPAPTVKPDNTEIIINEMKTFLKKDGSRQLTGNWSAGNHNITGIARLIADSVETDTLRSIVGDIVVTDDINFLVNDIKNIKDVIAQAVVVNGRDVETELDDRIEESVSDDRYLHRDGKRTATGDLDMNNNKVKRVTDATEDHEAVNKGQLDGEVSTLENVKLNRDGELAMTGDLDMNGFDVEGVDSLKSSLPIKVDIGLNQVAEFKDTQFKLYQTLNFNNQDIVNIKSINNENFNDLVAELRALEGGIVYQGKLTDSAHTTEFINGDKTPLNNFIESEEGAGRSARMGDMVKDYEGGEWYFGESNWKYMGRVEIDLKAYALESDTMLLDGTNAMTNDMDMGGNDVVNIGQVKGSYPVILGDGGVSIGVNGVGVVDVQSDLVLITQDLLMDNTDIRFIKDIEGHGSSIGVKSDLDLLNNDLLNVENLNANNTYTKAEVEQRIQDLATKHGLEDDNLTPTPLSVNDTIADDVIVANAFLHLSVTLDDVNSPKVIEPNKYAVGDYVEFEIGTGAIGTRETARLTKTDNDTWTFTSTEATAEMDITGYKIKEITAEQVTYDGDDVQTALDNKRLTADVTVTVGSSGKDFTNINDALEYLTINYQTTYIKEGISAVVLLAEDFTIQEQVLIEDIDLSWITIMSEASANDYDITAIEEGTVVDAGTAQVTEITDPDGDDEGTLTLYRPDGSSETWVMGSTETITNMTELATAINNETGFTATEDTGTITVTNDDVGAVDAPETDGLSATVTTQGEDAEYKARFVIASHTVEIGDNIIIRDHEGTVEEVDYNGYYEVTAVDTDWVETAQIYDADKVTATLGNIRLADPIIIDGDWLINNGVSDWEFFYQPTFGVARGKMPTIGCLFEMVFDTEEPPYALYLDGFCATDRGEMNFLPFAGVIGAGGCGIYGTRQSLINANDVFAVECGRHGFWAYSGTIINARRGFAYGNGKNADRDNIGRIDTDTFVDEISGAGIIATRGSIINADSATATDNYADNIHAEHGSIISAPSVESFNSTVGEDYGMRYGGMISRDGEDDGLFIDGERRVGESHLKDLFPHMLTDNRDSFKKNYGLEIDADGGVDMKVAYFEDTVVATDTNGNDLTLKEIFDDNDIFNGDGHFINTQELGDFYEFDTGIVSFDENGLVVTNLSQYNRIRYNYGYTENDEIYIGTIAKTNDLNMDRISIAHHGNIDLTEDYQLLSSYSSLSSSSSAINLAFFRSSSYEVETAKNFVKYLIAVDVSIFATEPTQEQMDEWLNLWLEIQENGYAIKETIKIKESV